jgi:Transposase DDE domain
MQRGKGHGTAVGSNVQTAVDHTHQRLIANDVTTDTGDRDGLRPMALQATDILGGTCAAVAEVGSDHGEAVKTGLEAGITPDIARPVTAANPKLGRCSTDAFTDDGATATSQCPAGAPRTCRVATVELGRPIRDDAPSACTACPLTPPCPRHQGGRRLTRWGDEPLVAAMEPRGCRRPEVMRQRQPRVEHPFGTLKRWWDAGDF